MEKKKITERAFDIQVGLGLHRNAMDIRCITPDDPAAQKLIAESDRYLQSLYPSESNHLESVQSLMSPDVSFFGCYIGSTLVGCGAVKILCNDGTYGEIKRLFVTEDCRGKGVSVAIMDQLEGRMIESGIRVSRLETGIQQPEALGLYKKLGYFVRGPFGDYGPDPLSVFMEKKITE